MKTIVLDIETIPDTVAMDRCRYVDDGSFAPYPLHQIACASAFSVTRMMGGELRFELQSFSLGSMSERGIVASIEQLLETANQVLTFNGYGFDLPVLELRGILAQERVARIHSLAGEGINSRHRDLLRMLPRYAPSVSLAQFCAPFGIPVKTGGPSVAKLAATGDWTAIENYCETDVVATWLAVQMLASVDQPGHGLARWRELTDWIEAERPPNPRLRSFVDALQRELAEQRATRLLPAAANLPFDF